MQSDFYRLVGCLCENIASSAGHARSRGKIEFPQQWVVTACHLNASHFATIVFSCVCDKWAIVFLLRFPLPVTKDVLHMTPPSQALTFLIEGPLFLLVIVFSSFFQNVKPFPPPDNDKKTQWTQRAGYWFQTHLTITFSNPKYFTGCQLDVNRLIDSLKSWESTRMSLPLKPPTDNSGFYLVFIATTHWIMKHLPFNCQLHKEWSG